MTFLRMLVTFFSYSLLSSNNNTITQATILTMIWAKLSRNLLDILAFGYLKLGFDVLSQLHFNNKNFIFFCKCTCTTLTRVHSIWCLKYLILLWKLWMRLLGVNIREYSSRSRIWCSGLQCIQFACWIFQYLRTCRLIIEVKISWPIIRTNVIILFCGVILQLLWVVSTFWRMLERLMWNFSSFWIKVSIQNSACLLQFFTLTLMSIVLQALLMTY